VFTIVTDIQTQDVGIPVKVRGIAKRPSLNKENAHVYTQASTIVSETFTKFWRFSNPQNNSKRYISNM
jgi:hypothetical protein